MVWVGCTRSYTVPFHRGLEVFRGLESYIGQLLGTLRRSYRDPLFAQPFFMCNHHNLRMK